MARGAPSRNRRVVVVTGASAGVGRAAARRFARSGAAVALLGREPEALEQTSAEIIAEGGEAAAFPLDMADAPAVFAAAEMIETDLGPVDVWVNNAMATVFGSVAELSPDEVRRVTEVTYLGYVHGTMAALRRMRERDAGVIVQVGSALAYRGIPLQAAYCGAKHAIRGFTDSLRCELLHERSRIRLTAVHLPAMNTPQFDWARTHRTRRPRPVAPVCQPEVAARAIVRAADRPAREYWLGGGTPLTILGNMLAPELLDRYLARVAVEGQDRSESVQADRQDNLFAPVKGVHRTRGGFDEEAQDSAPVIPGTLAPAAAAVVGAAAFFALGGLAGRALGRPAGRS